MYLIDREDLVLTFELSYLARISNPYLIGFTDFNYTWCTNNPLILFSNTQEELFLGQPYPQERIASSPTEAKYIVDFNTLSSNCFIHSKMGLQ